MTQRGGNQRLPFLVTMEEHCSRLADLRPLRFSICVAGHWPHVWPMFLGPWLVGTQWSSCQRMCQARTLPTAYWAWALQVLFRCWNPNRLLSSSQTCISQSSPSHSTTRVFCQVLSLKAPSLTPHLQTISQSTWALPSKPIWNLTTSHHSHWSRRLSLSPELL